jgi:hypothetical protein
MGTAQVSKSNSVVVAAHTVISCVDLCVDVIYVDLHEEVRENLYGCVFLREDDIRVCLCGLIQRV